MSVGAGLRLDEAVRSLALGPLHQGVTIVSSTDTETAVWVSRGGAFGPRILVNERLCRELPMGCLETLVAHEILHHVYYAGTWFGGLTRNRRLLNFALDAVVDRILYACPRHRRHLVELDDLLWVDASPLCMVLHPEPGVRLLGLSQAHRDAHAALWGPGRIPSVDEAVSMFAPLIGDDDGALEDVQGGHWRPGRGTRSRLRHVERRPRAAAAAGLVSLLRRARAGARPVVLLPHLARPTRGALVNAALGQGRLDQRHANRATSNPVEIYVDVSASMEPLRDRVADALVAARTLLPSTLWMFDTAVRAGSLASLLTGSLLTGDGTSFDEAIAHALRRGTRRMVLLTDGGDVVSPGVLADARRCGLRLFVGCFGSAEPPAHLAEVSCWMVHCR